MPGYRTRGAAHTIAGHGAIEVLLVVLLGAMVVLGGCSGSTASPGGTVNPDQPPRGSVWFGTAFDATTYVLGERFSTVEVNRPFSLVAHLTKSMDAPDLNMRTTHDDVYVSQARVNATGTGVMWGFTPTPPSAPGTWQYDFVDAHGNVLASGSISATASQ